MTPAETVVIVTLLREAAQRLEDAARLLTEIQAR